jgi:hypothetical protein
MDTMIYFRGGLERRRLLGGKNIGQTDFRFLTLKSIKDVIGLGPKPERFLASAFMVWIL